MKHLFLTCLLLSSFLYAEESLAEDPTQILKGQKTIQGKPWEGKSPEEVRAWAKENLHHKLIGRRLISEEENPEWQWFRKSGLGIFLHWGLASVEPASGDAWAMVWNEHRSKHELLQLPEDMFAAAETWNPESYDPGKWMKAANEAGFGYAVLTTRHHDGYCLWPSAHGEWDTGEYMEGRDLLGDYVQACRENDIRVGLYYSGPNWHFAYKQKDFSHPPMGFNYKHEKAPEGTKLAPIMGGGGLPPELQKAEAAESHGQVTELLKNYGDIDMLWWDGNSIMKEEEVHSIQSNTFVARGNIATPEGAGHGKSEKVKVTNEAGWWWELCIKPEYHHTPNWHYNEINEDPKHHWDTNMILTELIRCRALGGNLLLNVTPRPDGTMMDWYYASCKEMAKWMAHSKEAIYDVRLTAPLPMLDITDNYTTVAKDGTLYTLPNDRGTVKISELEEPKSVTILRTGEAIDYTFTEGTFSLTFPKEKSTSLPDLVKVSF